MIPRHLELTLEQLLPLIERHDLVVAGHTAAALHGLTVRDATELELATRTARDPRETSRLGLELHERITELQPALATLGPTGLAVGSVKLHTGDDYTAVTVPGCNDPLGRDNAEAPELLAVSVGTIDPTIQPVLDPCRVAVSPGGIRVPAVDQPTVGREALRAWLARPHDTVTCADLGLAAHRMGAETLWTWRTAQAAGGRAARLSALLVAEAPQRLAAAGIPPRLAARALEGLCEVRHSLSVRQQELVRTDRVLDVDTRRVGSSHRRSRS